MPTLVLVQCSARRCAPHRAAPHTTRQHTYYVLWRAATAMATHTHHMKQCTLTQQEAGSNAN